MKNTKNYIFTAMFASLILMGTSFMPIPTFNGYIHIGDALIYLCCAFLPLPFSLLAAGIGASLADLIGGYAQFIPFTFVVKALMTIFFSNKSEKILSRKNAVALIFAGLVNIVGYYIAEMILYGQDTFAKTLIVSASSIPGNIIQSVGSSVIFVVVAFALDKIDFKKNIRNIK